MLFSVEQAFVGRDEKRTPLTPAWEALLRSYKQTFSPAGGLWNPPILGDPGEVGSGEMACVFFRTDFLPLGLQEGSLSITIKVKARLL